MVAVIDISQSVGMTFRKTGDRSRNMVMDSTQEDRLWLDAHNYTAIRAQ